jgi:hypothetical protein
MKPSIYFSITNNCDLECGHCFQSSGPGRPSIFFTDFKKVIDNLPKAKTRLELTGGEVFTQKKLLYDCLDYVKQKNNGKKRFEVMVQTNGSWATSSLKVRKILTELADRGVDSLDVTSQDKYHLDQGLDQDKLSLIVDESYDLNVPWGRTVSPRGAGYKNILPIGRAKELPKSHFNKKYNLENRSCEGCFSNYNLNINRKGEVHMCCFDLFPLPGNVIDEPLVDIVRRARKNELLKKVNGWGHCGAPKILGMSDEDIARKASKYGACGFCARYYDENKEEILEAINK